MASLPEVSLITSWYAAPPLPSRGQAAPPAGLVHALKAGQPLLDLYFLGHGDLEWFATACGRAPEDSFPLEVRSCPLQLAAALEPTDLKNIASALRAVVMDHYSGRLVGPRPRFAALATYWPHLSSDEGHLQADSIRAVQNSLILARELGCRHVEIVGGPSFGSKDLANHTLPAPPHDPYSASARSPIAPREFKKTLHAAAMARLCSGLVKVYSNYRGRHYFGEDPGSARLGPYVCVEMEPGNAYSVQDVYSFLELHKLLREHPLAFDRVLLNIDLAHVFLADANLKEGEPTQYEVVQDHHLENWIGHFHISDHARSHASDLCPGTYHFLPQDYLRWLELAKQLMEQDTEDQNSHPKFSRAIAVEMEGCADIHEVLRAVGRTQHWLKSITPPSRTFEHQSVEGVILAVDIVNSTAVFIREGLAENGGANIINRAVSTLCHAIHGTNGSVLSFTGDGVIAFFDQRHFPALDKVHEQLLPVCGFLCDKMHEALQTVSRVGAADAYKDTGLRIALHYGKVVLPSHGPLQHQALGRDVIVTCRLLDDARRLMEAHLEKQPDAPMRSGVVATGKLLAALSISPAGHWDRLPVIPHNGLGEAAFEALTEGVYSWRQTTHIAPASTQTTPIDPGALQGFIAYDFTLLNGMFDNLMEDTLESRPAGKLQIHFPNDKTKPQGVIWRDYVRPHIDLSQKVLAFMDLPNANVGFEIGYALGKSKEVALVKYSETRQPWHESPPLKLHFIHPLRTASEIHSYFLEQKFTQLSVSPNAGKSIRLLCPDPLGGPIYKQIPPGWHRPASTNTTWDLGTIPQLFDGVGLLVWIILPPDAGETGRDGMANATFAILAGYALARPELILRVFAHESAPNIADAMEFNETFQSNMELREKLAHLEQQWSEGKLKPAP